MLTQLLGGTITIKALIIGVVAAVLDVAFIKALILVAVSAVLTGFFGIIIAVISAKQDEAIHKRLDVLESNQHTMQRAVGANKREDDPK